MICLSVTRDYCLNLFNKSEVQATEVNGVYIMVCTLPNGFNITRYGGSFDYCKEEILKQICEYEEYIAYDKKYYGYDLDEEYVDESYKYGDSYE